MKFVAHIQMIIANWLFLNTSHLNQFNLMVLIWHYKKSQKAALELSNRNAFKFLIIMTFDFSHFERENSFSSLKFEINQKFNYNSLLTLAPTRPFSVFKGVDTLINL